MGKLMSTDFLTLLQSIMQTRPRKEEYMKAPAFEELPC